MLENETRLSALRARLARLESCRGALTPDQVKELRAVFPVIVRAHHARVWGRLCRRLKDDDQASDIAQNAYKSLYIDIMERGFPEDLPRRLNAFALHHFLHHVRDHLDDQVIVGVPSSGSERPRSSRQLDVDRALDASTALTLPERLPPQYREVVEMMILDQMTAKEVSKILGIPEGTVNTRLRNAKQMMRDMLRGSAESRP